MKQSCHSEVNRMMERTKRWLYTGVPIGSEILLTHTCIIKFDLKRVNIRSLLGQP